MITNDERDEALAKIKAQCEAIKDACQAGDLEAVLFKLELTIMYIDYLKSED